MKEEIRILFITNVAAGISYSLPTTLYPESAMQKGYDEEFVGFVFSMYALANFIMIPFVNKLISIFGRVRLLQFSSVLNVSYLNFNQLSDRSKHFLHTSILFKPFNKF